MADSPTNDYLELVVDIHDRQYQRYSIDNSVYHLPVDEVGQTLFCFSFFVYPRSFRKARGLKLLRPRQHCAILASYVLTGVLGRRRPS